MMALLAAAAAAAVLAIAAAATWREGPPEDGSGRAWWMAAAILPAMGSIAAIGLALSLAWAQHARHGGGAGDGAGAGAPKGQVAGMGAGAAPGKELAAPSIEMAQPDAAQEEEGAPFPDGLPVEKGSAWDACPEAVGWISIPSCGISYPVMQGEDNSEYLHKGPDGKEDPVGSIFLDFLAPPDFRARNCFIFGHNMSTARYKGNAMFGHLKDLRGDPGILDADPNIYIVRADGMAYRYRVFAFHLTETMSPMYRDVADDAEEKRYIMDAVSLSMAAPSDIGLEGAVLDARLPMVTLSTCVQPGTDIRFMVHSIMDPWTEGELSDAEGTAASLIAALGKDGVATGAGRATGAGPADAGPMGAGPGGPGTAGGGAGGQEGAGGMGR